MVKKIKNLDVQDIRQQVDSTKEFIKQTKESVEQVKQALNAVTTLHDGFEGNSADSIRTFFEEAHKPFLEFMNSFLIQYEEILTSVCEEVLSFETGEHGFIREEFLQDELKSKLVKASTSLTSTSIDINQQLLYVKDIVDIPPVDSDPFIESINKGKEKLSDTLSNMYDMDARATKKLDTPEQDIEQMKTYLTKLKDAIDKNDITVDKFHISQFNREFFSYQDEFKLVAKGRNALVTGQKAEFTQDQFNSLFPFIKNKVSVTNDHYEWNGTYHTLKDGRIIHEYSAKDGPHFEFVDKIPNSRAAPPPEKTNIVMDILGPVWKDTVDYFTEDFKTLFDPESSWWQKGLAAAFMIPWGKGVKSEMKFDVKKGIDDIHTILNSKAAKSKRFKAGLSLLTPPNPGQQAFQFGEKYIKPVLLKDGGFLAKKVGGGKGKNNLSNNKKTKSATKGQAEIPQQTIKSNKGKSIDVTPSPNHTTTTSVPNPFKGEPNSSVDIMDKKTGEIKTRRFYGSDGRALRDVDYTNHGNPKTHPEWPHEHIFKWNDDGTFERK